MKGDWVKSPFVLCPVNDETGTIGHLVLIRIQTARRTSHQGVLMPTRDVSEDMVLQRLMEIGMKLNGHGYTIQIQE